jgi:hypothetical protein
MTERTCINENMLEGFHLSILFFDSWRETNNRSTNNIHSRDRNKFSVLSPGNFYWCTLTASTHTAICIHLEHDAVTHSTATPSSQQTRSSRQICCLIVEKNRSAALGIRDPISTFCSRSDYPVGDVSWPLLAII